MFWRQEHRESWFVVEDGFGLGPLRGPFLGPAVENVKEEDSFPY